MRIKLSALCILLAASSAIAAESKTPPLEVLSYSSMLGSGSLGDYLATEFKKKCPECEVKFSGTHDNAGLLGRLRDAKRRGISDRYDVVIGMGEAEFRQALVEGLVGTGKVYDKSAFAIIVDTQKIKAADWPKSWAELPTKLKGNLLIEDPRTSGSGVGWLTALYGDKLLDPVAAKAAVKRIYPTWSAAYEAFTKGEAPAVWSFLSSVAYHRCKEKTDRYQALPLKEGYPVQFEYIAQVKHAEAPQNPVPQAGPQPVAARFVDFVMSPEVQAAIPKKNWMFPGVDGTKLESCFGSPVAVKGLPKLPAFDLKGWMDKWSLQN